MEVIHEAPTSSSFTPLAVHQSQTPESFYTGPPVLYHHSPSASLSLHASDLAAAPALSSLANGAHRSSNGTSTAAVNGDSAAEEAGPEDEEIEIAGVDVWVTSERFILFSPTLSTGLEIPYPSISLHAVQRPSEGKPASLFLQLLIEAQTFDDHDPDSTISMTIIPAAAAAAAAAAAPLRTEATPEEAGHDVPEEESQAQRLYTALSACANLHPDPMSGSDIDVDEDDGGGQRPAIRFEGDQDIGGVYPLSNGDGGGSGLPPPMPGSGGWITAENVGEFFDEEGNWRGETGGGQEVDVSGGGLGEGAGTVRAREEDGGGEGVGSEGDGVEETKWRRTE